MRIIEVSETDKTKIQKLELSILVEVDTLCRKYGIHYSLGYGAMIGAVRHKGFIPWDDDMDIIMLREDYDRFKIICKQELGNLFYQSNDTDPEYFYLFDKVRLNGTVFRESFVSKYNIHHGIYIDIFPVDYLPDNKWKREIQYIKFHFCRLGIQSRYLMLSARKGKKKYAALFLRLVYTPFTLSWLYRKAHKISSAYNHDKSHNLAACFFSPYKRKDIFPASFFDDFQDCMFEGKRMMILKHYNEILTQLYGDYMQLPAVTDRESHHTITELQI